MHPPRKREIHDKTTGVGLRCAAYKECHLTKRSALKIGVMRHDKVDSVLHTLADIVWLSSNITCG